MTRTVRHFVVVLVVALALFGIFAGSAMATLEDTPTPTFATSMTNPDWGADAWWRGGWGNDTHPEFTVNAPPMVDKPFPDGDGYLLGFIYNVDRDLSSSL